MSNEEEKKPKPKPRRRRGRKGSGRHYFTQVHEDAIIEYCATPDHKRREELYVKFIQPAMSELVDKIVYTYKFTTLPNIDDLRDECKIWLTTVLDKFNPDKGSKAFSYFSVITKNWFIHKVKKHAIKRQREITFDQMPRHIEEKYLSTVNPYEGELEIRQFRAALNSEIDKWGQMPMKASEEKVYKAVKILLENPDDIEIFNKKAIYLYLRELTGLNTKQVVSNLNKLREKYRVFKADWDEGNVSHIEGETSECRAEKEKGKL
jgi:DNA-directed RNA polymerase specialized sigma subunit